MINYWLIMYLKMYLGTFAFSLIMKKCRNTLWSSEGWSPPPLFGRRFSFWIFRRSLCSILKSQYFPFFVLLNIVLFTTAFHGLVLLLSKPLMNLPSDALLITQAITLSEIKTKYPWCSILFQYKWRVPNPFHVLFYLLEWGQSWFSLVLLT